MNTSTYNENYAISTINIPSSGKWYFECTVVTVQTTLIIGVARQNTLYGVAATNAGIRAYANNGNKNAAASTTYGATYTSNDVIGIAVDSDAGEITFYKNGVSQGLAFADLNTAGGPWAPFTLCTAGSNAVVTFNAGQQTFAYTPPTGFKAINTFNMPLPTVTSGQDFNEPLVYTGNGFVQQVTGLQFQPDLVWTKARNLTEFGRMVDSLRGATLAVQSGNAVGQQTETNGLTSFDGTGFTVGSSGGASAGYNASGQSYASWSWAASQTTVNNTSGTISSQTRSNPTAGFSIVKYTGTGVNATVGHGAGGAPMFIIIKSLTSGTEGVCYHASVGPTAYMPFAQTNYDNQGVVTDATVFNNTAPTGTQFSIGTSTRTNAIGDEYIAYVWSEVPGYSAYGSYASSSTLPYRHCDFLPSIVVTRAASNGSANNRTYAGTLVKDDQRSSYGNEVPINLSWVSNNVENTITGGGNNNETYGVPIDLISSGWKLRGWFDPGTGTSRNSNNTATITMYWVAWARSPAKFTNAR